ncbi:MAG: VRR-NUC domain-containing protein [Hahellaceae bacterium]|nr:VRR-NUC domain-containing protein [Hahellaceae bacterium]
MVRPSARAATIPRTHLQAIFRRLLSNLRHNSSSFPDLIRFYGGRWLRADRNQRSR